MREEIEQIRGKIKGIGEQKKEEKERITQERDALLHYLELLSN